MRRERKRVPSHRRLPKAAQDWGPRGRLSRANRYGELEHLVLKLNDPDDPVWLTAARIVTASTTTEAARLFNALAETIPYHLHVSVEGADCWPDLVAGPGAAFHARQVARTVWEFFFRNRDKARLKRCEQCGQFFVDYARPNNSVRCSDRCTWQWWNRERRDRKQTGPSPRPRRTQR
jgi:hypothetical protein